MSTFRNRIWFGVGLSILAADGAVAQVPPAACPPSPLAVADPIGGGESGEGSGTPTEQRSVVVARMLVRLDASRRLREGGEAEEADRLIGAAVDEGPARLTRIAGRPEAALEAALTPLALTPADPAAFARARAAVDAAFTDLPAMASAEGRILLAVRMVNEVLAAYVTAVECGRIVDLAAYAEASGMAAAASRLAGTVAEPDAAAFTGELAKLVAALPAEPPALAPEIGFVASLISRAMLASYPYAR